MRRVWACLLCVVMLSGCGRGALLPYAREMGDTALVRAVGVDAREDGVELTVSTGSRAGGGEALVLSAQGGTLPAAAQAVQSLGDSYVYYGHADQMVIGEEQAVRGLDELMDYLARESELSLGMQMWAVRGGTALQVIQAGGNRGMAERLAQLHTDSEIGAANIGRTAAQLMSVLAREGSTYLPAIALAEKREEDGGAGGGVTPVPAGYGIIRQGKLVCWVDDDAARGIELMEGQVFGHVAELTLEDGAVVSVLLEHARVRCAPVFQGGALSGLDVRCDLRARVAQTQRKITDEELVRLQENLERMEGERMVQAVELGQYWDADYLGLQQRMQMARPNKKAEIAEQWEAAFRSLNVRVDVRGTIAGAFGM